MALPFSGRVALVTGAASGMGRLAAERLAGAGAAVAALDVDEEGLRQTASGRSGIRSWGVDVSNPQAVAAAVAEVESALGPIDRVMVAAAIMPSAPLLEQTPEAIARVMEVNYGGIVNVALATLPHMLGRGRGELILFASLAGWIPAPLLGAYSASKFAVVAFSEVLHHENRGKGVRILCVCPPKVDTPLVGRADALPRAIAEAPALRPEQVLDAIERGVERGAFWVFPGRGSKLAWRSRRLLPNLVWRYARRREGLA